MNIYYYRIRANKGRGFYSKIFFQSCTVACLLGVLVSRQISKIEEGKVKHSQLSSMALLLSQEDISCLQTELKNF